MEKFRAIQRKKGYVEIVEQLRGLIEQGTLLPGEKLPPERELAHHLGSSRPTLREALAALEIQGYLTIVNGRGIYVAESARERSPAVTWEPDLADSPFHLLEVRLALEPAAAALATRRAGEQDLETLDRLVGEMGSHLEATGRFPSELDLHFHRAVARATGNPLFQSLTEAVLERMTHPLWTRLKGRTYEHPGRARLYLEQHRELLEAIRRGDAQAAEAAMHTHLRQVEGDLLQDPEEAARVRPEAAGPPGNTG
ncbi:FadR/GntR family transcriptional regulator [Limnochorda pilosa]|uniref:GntR family transcriptional regulator n=1 Tax=Limnochorda pilosa TaxID=1555112 RepID=A0A0K2SG87_LIMPI|nr:FadR/GntR family transcriptional regulator [Limnochorda pilosa]BAS26105.1 GntR family transcriptional regulator [Limnochorda pilosa]